MNEGMKCGLWFLGGVALGVLGAVAVSKGQSGFVRLGTEDAFAFIVFAQGKGGAGQVTQELGAVVSQYLRCIQLIVFGPAVFAEHDADGDARTFDVDSDRLYCFGYAAVFFGA